MAKTAKTVFFCKECGYESSKWLGQCPGCREVGTFVEEPTGPKNKVLKRSLLNSEPVCINEVSAKDEERVTTGFSELDRVLGGGVVPGGLILVGGDPGIGKSTLLLQVCRNMSDNGKKILYISGEESLKQIKLRANRMGEFSDNLSLLSETSLDAIEAVILDKKPDIVIIDSIQTIFREDISSAPGSVSQVRESTNTLMQIAKGNTIPIFIVGHVTKEGVVAGPRVLEHMVDTVLYFEGDRHASYRILRGVKNRFGSTNEIGVFEMREDGLHQVLVEIQALINHTAFGMPRRTSVGTDYNRVNLLMAVIEKRVGIQMGDYDAYVNVAGGMKINEPAIDLALIMALISSYKNRVINPDTIVFGEVGLAGEVRAVSQAEQRVLEAKKLGFRKCILPAVSAKSIKKIDGIELIGVNNIREAGEQI